MKWRYFRHLLGGDDPDAERVYRWHLTARKAANAKVNLGMDSKSGTDQYVADCKSLVSSMGRDGFLPQYAIPIDPHGDLLGGAHRTACALALGIETVPVLRMEKVAWAPAWDLTWFEANGVDPDDLYRIAQDWQMMNEGLKQ